METRARKAPAIHSEYILPELGAFCKRQRLLPSYPYRQYGYFLSYLYGSCVPFPSGVCDNEHMKGDGAVEMKLSENIRAFRKARWLTQEQLAEVLGVTVGAVYKWESRLSQPELRTIMDLADFFDVSIDVLLGYKMKDNRLQAAEARVSDRNRDFTAALRDCLDGFPVIKTFRAEKEIFRLFAENSRALEDEKFSRRRRGHSLPGSPMRWKGIRRRRASFSCPGCRTASDLRTSPSATRRTRRSCTAFPPNFRRAAHTPSWAAAEAENPHCCICSWQAARPWRPHPSGRHGAAGGCAGVGL